MKKFISSVFINLKRNLNNIMKRKILNHVHSQVDSDFDSFTEILLIICIIGTSIAGFIMEDLLPVLVIFSFTVPILMFSRLQNIKAKIGYKALNKYYFHLGFKECKHRLQLNDLFFTNSLKVYTPYFNSIPEFHRPYNSYSSDTITLFENEVLPSYELEILGTLKTDQGCDRYIKGYWYYTDYKKARFSKNGVYIPLYRKVFPRKVQRIFILNIIGEKNMHILISDLELCLFRPTYYKK